MASRFLPLSGPACRNTEDLNRYDVLFRKGPIGPFLPLRPKLYGNTRLRNNVKEADLSSCITLISEGSTNRSDRKCTGKSRLRRLPQGRKEKSG